MLATHNTVTSTPSIVQVESPVECAAVAKCQGLVLGDWQLGPEHHKFALHLCRWQARQKEMCFCHSAVHPLAAEVQVLGVAPYAAVAGQRKLQVSHAPQLVRQAAQPAWVPAPTWEVRVGLLSMVHHLDGRDQEGGVEQVEGSGAHLCSTPSAGLSYGRLLSRGSCSYHHSLCAQ